MHELWLKYHVNMLNQTRVLPVLVWMKCKIYEPFLIVYLHGIKEHSPEWC